MPKIEVDFDVYKALTQRRPSEDFSENDVLRQLLGLGAPASAERVASPRPGDWISKGVRFPEGTEFRAHYKGRTHLATVEKGALVLQGRRHDSPSAAAMAVTNGTPVNGWTFWECRLPGQTAWRVIKRLRKEAAKIDAASML